MTENRFMRNTSNGSAGGEGVVALNEETARCGNVCRDQEKGNSPEPCLLKGSLNLFGRESYLALAEKKATAQNQV